MMNWHIVEGLAIPAESCPSHYAVAFTWCRACIGHNLFFVVTLSLFPFYSQYILNYHAECRLYGASQCQSFLSALLLLFYACIVM